jgi:hypothetical protein
MNTDTSLLPPGFEALEPFVKSWAIAGSANRAQRRNASDEAERIDFYEAAKAAAPTALAFLDRKPLRDFDEREERLMNLMLTLAHVALAVEAQGSDEARHAQSRQYLTIIRTPADLHA